MRRSSVLLLCATLSGVAGAEPPAPTAPVTVAAVWEEHELIFRYQGFTTLYSCQGLRSKVRDLLEALGAREGFSVRPYGCASAPFEPSPIAGVKLKFATLRPLADDSGETSQAAVWRSVRLSRPVTRFLERGDCFLIERFRDQVLPAFTHEVVWDRTRCIPHSLDGSAPNLSLRVLAPLGTAPEPGA